MSDDLDGWGGAEFVLAADRLDTPDVVEAGQRAFRPRGPRGGAGGGGGGGAPPGADGGGGGGGVALPGADAGGGWGGVVLPGADTAAVYAVGGGRPAAGDGRADRRGPDRL